MPTGYQCFKATMYKRVKSLYFVDYKLKDGENMASLISKKCKEEWVSLSQIQKSIYNEKAEEKTNLKKEAPPPYESGDENINVEEIEVDGKVYYLEKTSNNIYDPETE